MKIGVFGDSYADRHAAPGTIWWSLLQQNHGHDVECFGENASSLLYSAKKILEHHRLYDLVIWCTTQPGRLSLDYGHVSFHFQISQSDHKRDGNNIQAMFEIWKKYMTTVVDWQDEKLQSKAVIEMVQNHCPNVLIVPGFQDPLDADFNLFSVFQREVEMLYGGNFSDDFYKDYVDARIGHLSQESHEILANELATCLRPGIFQMDLDRFPRFVDPPFIGKQK